MELKSGKDVFLALLSNVWNGNKKVSKFYQEMGQLAQDPTIKAALDGRVFIADQIQGRLDECFRLLGEKPLPASDRLLDVFVEDFRKEANEIRDPVARRLYVLAKVSHLIHIGIGQYLALVAAADMTGNYELGVLLESCLADKVAFAERTRRHIKHMVREKVAEKMAA
jgi:ferritin-like metal-binding protein YciE